MNRILFLLILPLFLFVLPAWKAATVKAQTKEQGTLIVNIENVKLAKGNLRLGIYNSEASYLAEDKPDYWKVGKADRTGRVQLSIDDLPFGKYAIAMIHDINENEEMDFNFIGIPKEPYGFSKKTAKLKKPPFSEVQFNFTADRQKVNVELVEW